MQYLILTGQPTNEVLLCNPLSDCLYTVLQLVNIPSVFRKVFLIIQAVSSEAAIVG